MFIFLSKYEFKFCLKQKSLLFWCFIFPFILGTIFRLVFPENFSSNLANNIPIYVNKEYSKLYSSMKINGSKLFSVKDYSDPKKALKDNKIIAIIDFKKDFKPDILVKSTTKDNINLQQSVIYETTKYIYHYGMAGNIVVENNPSLYKKIKNNIKSEDFYNDFEKKIQKSNLKSAISLNNNNFINLLFYSLMAMICLSTSSLGVELSKIAIINKETIGFNITQRLLIAPVTKIKIISAKLFSYYCFSIINSIVLYSYIKYILKISFGNNSLYVLLTLLLGNLLALLFGVFNGIVIKGNDSIKQSINAFIYVISGGFLTGMMVSTIPSIINNYVPIINYINPGSVLYKMFISLYLNDYKGYVVGLINTALLICIIYLILYLITRRKHYGRI